VPSRRDFLKHSALTCAWCAGAKQAWGTPGVRPLVGQEAAAEEHAPVEARYYEKQDDLRIVCRLCPRECVVADRERGYCGVRENRRGTYYTLVHSDICAEHIDPVEKKPVFHFLPGTRAYSIATAGCNIECKFCQNWEISQFRPEQVRSMRRTPDDVARIAKSRGCRSIAYTYSEPVIFYEYMYDCAVAARARGIKSIMISNGYIQPEPLRELIKVLDAVKIDLKAFTDRFYRELCSGTLAPVLETLKILKESEIWFEIVVLLIPSWNDSAKEITALCEWVAENLGDSVPIHFTRFHPTYKIKNIARTPLDTLESAYEIARTAGLKFPYIGNVPEHEGDHTHCPECSKALISRIGFKVINDRIEEDQCPYCSKKIPGIWK